jgi:DNA-binding transcriptional regulator YiaG
MGMNKKCQSEALMVSHQAAQDLFELGVIDAAEMREYDEACLVSEPTPKASRAKKTPTPAYTHPRQA